MKKLLFACAGLLTLCTLGLTPAKAGPDYYRDDDRGYYHRQHEYRSDDDCDYRPRHRVVIREYETDNCRPRYYYRSDDCQPRYYHRRPHVSFYLPLPPLPPPPF